MGIVNANDSEDLDAWSGSSTVEEGAPHTQSCQDNRKHPFHHAHTSRPAAHHLNTVHGHVHRGTRGGEVSMICVWGVHGGGRGAHTQEAAGRTASNTHALQHAPPHASDPTGTTQRCNSYDCIPVPPFPSPFILLEVGGGAREDMKVHPRRSRMEQALPILMGTHTTRAPRLISTDEEMHCPSWSLALLLPSTPSSAQRTVANQLGRKCHSPA
jgi:hypothetical protein